MSPAAAPAFPWGETLDFCLRVLRLPPAAIWTLTPPELGAAFAARHAAMRPPARADLAALMAAFPDTAAKEPSWPS